MTVRVSLRSYGITGFLFRWLAMGARVRASTAHRWQLSAQCFISFFNSILFGVRHFQHANSSNHSSFRHRLRSGWIRLFLFFPSSSSSFHANANTAAAIIIIVLFVSVLFAASFYSFLLLSLLLFSLCFYRHFCLSLHVFHSMELPFNVSTFFFFFLSFHMYL